LRICWVKSLNPSHILERPRSFSARRRFNQTWFGMGWWKPKEFSRRTQRTIRALVSHPVILSGAKNLALDFSAEKQQSEMLLPQGGISLTVRGRFPGRRRVNGLLRMPLECNSSASAKSVLYHALSRAG
jgi:hypothetical protein